MATRKKTSPDSETVRADEFAAASQKLTRARKSAATEASATAEKKAKSNSPAATHKAPARKSAPTAPAPEPAVEALAAETITFDVSLHHEEISKEAYHTWLRNGCPQGTEHNDWLAAIEIVRARH